MSKVFVVLGCINAFLAVAFGAFGAHGLKATLTSDMLAVYHTGVQYHSMHALGLIAVGIIAHWLPESAGLRWGGWLMLTGIILFSGSLYLLSISGVRSLGAVTPFGGLSFLAAWAMVALAAVKGL